MGHIPWVLLRTCWLFTWAPVMERISFPHLCPYYPISFSFHLPISTKLPKLDMLCFTLFLSNRAVTITGYQCNGLKGWLILNRDLVFLYQEKPHRGFMIICDLLVFLTLFGNMELWFISHTHTHLRAHTLSHTQTHREKKRDMRYTYSSHTQFFLPRFPIQCLSGIE